MYETLKENQWWNDGETGAQDLARQFNTPARLFREAQGSNDYGAICDGATSNNLCASAIFDKHTPFGHLLDGSYGFIARMPTYNLIAVSTVDVNSWLERAMRIGALAVTRGNYAATPWVYKTPVNVTKVRVDDNRHLSNEQRLAKALRGTGRPRGQTKDYDKEDIVRNLLAGCTQQEMALKYRLSRFTVWKISTDAGISKKQVKG